MVVKRSKESEDMVQGFENGGKAMRNASRGILGHVSDIFRTFFGHRTDER